MIVHHRLKSIGSDEGTDSRRIIRSDTMGALSRKLNTPLIANKQNTIMLMVMRIDRQFPDLKNHFMRSYRVITSSSPQR